jgi:hypothetical protein
MNRWNISPQPAIAEAPAAPKRPAIASLQPAVWPLVVPAGSCSASASAAFVSSPAPQPQPFPDSASDA